MLQIPNYHYFVKLNKDFIIQFYFKFVCASFVLFYHHIFASLFESFIRCLLTVRCLKH